MDAEISKAWQRAADELGIRVTAPYDLPLLGSRVVRVEAYVPDFGSPKGAVALSQGTQRLAPELKHHGQWCSILFEGYRVWDRELFIGTLDDWGWFGPKGEEPSWYTGKPWS